MIKSAAARLALSSTLILATIATVAFGSGCSSNVDGAEAEDKATQDDSKKPASQTVSAKDGANADKADICGRLCAREVACDPATDQDTCVSKCNNTNATFVEKLRDDYSTEVASCLDKSACKDIDSGTAISTCVDEAGAKVSVTTAATDFCDAFAASATKCGEKLDKAACYNSAKIYSDATLADANKCFGKKCADIDACVSAATGGTPDTSTPPPPPPSCSAKMPYSDSTCGTCMSALCCAEDNACANNSSCTSYLSCIQACTTSACQTSCGSSYPTGKSLLSSLGACMSDSCPASCGD